MIPGPVRSALFASPTRSAVTALVALAAVVAGAVAFGFAGVPSVEAVDNEFGGVNDTHTEIHTDLTIDNPNPVGAGSADVSTDYVVSANGVELARGGADDVTVAPGQSTESFTTHMRNDRIPEWWASHVRNDERTDVAIDAEVHSGALDRTTSVTESRTVETDVVSAFESDESRPVDAGAPLIEDPILSVTATRGEWGSVDDAHTHLDLQFDVYNPKAYDQLLTRIGYTVSMNDVVVGEGATDREYVLESDEVTTVETTATIENDRLDDWWVTHLQNDQVTDLRIEFEAQFELFGPDTTVTVPLEPLTYEERIETDVFGDDRSDEADARRSR